MPQRVVEAAVSVAEVDVRGDAGRISMLKEHTRPLDESPEPIG